MNQYIIQIKAIPASYKISYQRGQFKKLEHITGKLSDDQHQKIMLLVPSQEKNITNLQEEYVGRVEWIAVLDKKKHSIFSQLNQLYFDFYTTRFGLKPKFTGTEGKALKQIIHHLEELCYNDEEQIPVLFSFILQKWDLLPDFYRSQAELRQINSNLNIILRHLKHGKEATQKGANSSSFRDKL